MYLDDLKMLLDRDNPLEGDEVHRESIQSPFKSESFFILM